MAIKTTGRILAGTCILFIALLVPMCLQAGAAKSEKDKRPYASSGAIPGTSLTYENLFINGKGIATITIHNPTSTGVSFSANFSFYDDKRKYVTGFTVSGYAAAAGRNALFTEVKDYKKLKKATHMKVLGRSGRSVE